MSSYNFVSRPFSACVHFVYADETDESVVEVAEILKRAGIVWAYVDYLDLQRRDELLENAIATSLKLENAPYGPRRSAYEPVAWVPFADDLATLSHNVNGAVIILDHADVLLADNSRIMFALIENFLLQFHHWSEKKKPCHLVFQMEPNEWVKRAFAPGP
jgi:hypothetical protein